MAHDLLTLLHPERHRTHRTGWLRAAVLGANDGVISTASLLVGVAASHAAPSAILIAGTAGLAAGAMAMAAGEYVSVSSQWDTEQADLAREQKELLETPDSEHAELTQIYVERGLTPELAGEVATQLMAKDALGAHAREELGITEALAARPVQAALASAATFVSGAIVPLLAAVVSPAGYAIIVIIGATLVVLGVLGALAARVGGASPVLGAMRVLFWGAMAMGVTAGVGAIFRLAV
ncbi:MAG: VIT1/CCC1 transporter family protein [Tepidisphaeraceae bacterium]